MLKKKNSDKKFYVFIKCYVDSLVIFYFVDAN